MTFPSWIRHLKSLVASSDRSGRKAPRKKGRARRPEMERLEDRTVPAFTASLSGTTVSFLGDTNSDYLQLTRNSSGYLVHNRSTGEGFASSIDLDTSAAGVQSLLVASLTNLVVNAGGSAESDQIDLNGLTYNGTATLASYFLRVQGDTNMTLTNTSLSLGGGGSYGLTNVRYVYLFGGNGANTLDASAFTGYAQLYGQDGNDTLKAGSGGSWLDGGLGNDTLTGGAGSDRVYVSRDADMTLTGTSLTIGATETDTLSSIEYAQLQGGDSANTLDASAFPGGVTIYGYGGSDTLKAGSGGSYIDGGSGDDTLTGGAGSDQINVSRDADMTLTGTSLTIGATETDTLSSIEYAQLQGGNSANALDASAFPGGVTIYGYGGNDTLKAGSGGAYIDGGLGDDTLDASASTGNVNLYGQDGNDTLKAGSGGSYLDGGLGNDTLTGGAGYDRVGASRDADMTLTGTSLTIGATETDTLSSIEYAQLQGGDSANALDASAFPGGVTIYGYGGNDTLKAGSGGGYIDGGSGDDTLDASASTSSVNLYGSDGNDALKAGPAGGTLSGGSGDDTLNASASTVYAYLYGQDGNDTLKSGSGGGNLSGGQGDDTLDASASTGSVQLYGEGGNDTLKAGSIGAYLDGGAGTNSASLLATGGNDTITIASSYVLINGSYTNYYNINALTIDAGPGIDEGTIAGTLPSQLQLTILNLEPKVLPGGNASLAEGSTFSRSGSFNDPSSTSWTGEVDYGDGSGAQSLPLNANRTFNLSHPYADDGTYTVTVRVTNSSGGTGTAQFTVNVSNVAPRLAVSGADRVDEGSTYTLALGQVTDPGADAVTRYIVRWGDGATETIDVADLPANGQLTHVYADGTVSRAINVTLIDEDGAHSGAAIKTLVVDNVAPTLTLDGDSSLNEGSTYTLTLGAVNDPGQDAVSKYVIHWGDGQTQQLAAADLPASRQVQHVYTDGPASRTITVDLVDEDAYVAATSYAFDTGFGSGGVTRTDYLASGNENGRAVASAQGPDGKVVVLADTSSGLSFVRYNADGSPDAGFGVGGRVPFSWPSNFGFSYGPGLVIDAEGRMLVAGYVYNYSGSTGYDFALARYGADGAIDAGFGSGGVLAIDLGSYEDFANNLSLDTQGRLLLTGVSYNTANGTYDLAVVRLLADGSPDPDFGEDGKAFADFGDYWETGRGVAAAPDGKVVVLADTNTGTSFVRFNADGSLDTGFGTAGRAAVSRPGNFNFYNDLNLVIDTEGRMLVAGYVYNGGTTRYDFAVARYNADSSGASLLATINLGSSDDFANDLSFDTQGRLLLTGQTYNTANSSYDLAVVRLLANGSLDPDFGEAGIVRTDYLASGYEYGRAVASAQGPDGKVVVLTDTNSGTSFIRYNTDGSLDTGFGTAGRVRISWPGSFSFDGMSLAVDAGGKILLAGYSYGGSTNYDFAVARFNSDGTIDTGFGSNGVLRIDLGFSQNDFARGLTLDEQGRILLTGQTYNPGNGTYDLAVVRLLADGTPDGGFGTGGIARTDFSGYENGLAVAAAQVSGGKVVVLADTSSGTSFVRFNDDGTLDTGFGTGGRTPFNWPGNFSLYEWNLAVDAEGRMLVAGYVYNYSGSTGSDFAVARFDADGAIDAGFGDNGVLAIDLGSYDDYARDLTLDYEGRLLLTGQTYNAANNSQDLAVVRLAPVIQESAYEGVASKQVTVDNVAPTATLSDGGPITYGQALTVSFSDQADDSSVDSTAGFHYAYSTSGTFEGVTYASTAGSLPTHDFAGLAAGSHTVYARIIDKDDGYTQFSVDVTVAQAVLTVTADDDSKVYDGVAYGGGNGVSYSGFVYGEGASVLGGALAFSGDSQGARNTGTYTITPGGLTSDNYEVRYADATLTISARGITVTADHQTKVYGDADPALTFTVGGLGLAGGDTQAAVFTGGLARAAGGHVGTYAITQGTLAANANYTITAFTADTLSITPRAITVSAVSDSKTYDGDTASSAAPAVTSGTLADGDTPGFVQVFDSRNAGARTLSASGEVNDGNGGANYSYTFLTAGGSITPRGLVGSFTADDKVYDGTAVAGVTGSSLPGVLGGDVVVLTVGNARFDDKNAGTDKAVTADLALVGADAGNYAVNATATTTADVTPRALVVTAAGVDKVYDGTTAAAVTLTDNRVAGDVLSAGYATATFADKHAGTAKPVAVGGISIAGPDAGNYTVNDVASATADVTPRALTVSAAGVNKVYDGTAAASVNLSDDRVGGDVFTASYAGASFADKNVGQGKAVSVSGLSISGPDAGNYSANATASTAADVTPRALAVSAAAADKVYDGNDLASVALSDDRVGGDVVSVTYASATFGDKNVGASKAVTVSGISISGADAGNYTVNGTATDLADITPRALVVTAAGLNKVYDGTPSATVTLSDNRVLGDAVTTAHTGATFADKNVGVGKAVAVAGISISGADAGNYSFNTSAAATADITAKVITGSVTADSKVYDGNTSATILTRTLAGVVEGDDVSYTGGSATFADKNVGVAKAVSASGLGLVGADAANYTVNATAATTADITAKAITGSVTADSKVYDGNTSATILSRSLSGVVVGDAVTYVGGTATFSDANVGGGKPVTATGLSLAGADAGNYSVNSTASTTANITAAPLTIKADNASRQYSDPNPAFTASYVGFVGGEGPGVLGGTLSFTTPATSTSAPGPYAITPAGLTSSNYTLGFANGTLTVTKEDARATYTGLQYVTTASASSSVAAIVLSATVRDITADTGDPAHDAFAGDVRNATVTFVNRDTGAVIAQNLPVGLVSAGDAKTGTASYTWAVDIGTADSKTFTVGVIVNNYYERNSSADNTLVTVTKPTAGSISGGGYLVNSASAGAYAGDVGEKTNFGLNAKFDKGGSNLKGNVNVIVRRRVSGVLRTYQIDSTAIDSLSLASPSAGVTKATLIGKANVTDVTDSRNPVSLGGNKQLQITMTDNGEPGRDDTIAVQLSDPNGGLLFSSRWTGTQTVEQLLGGGNLQVRLGQVLAGAAASGRPAPAPLTLNQLQPTIAAAKATWQAAGYRTDLLDNVTFRIDNLPGGELGWKAAGAGGAGVVTIDSDAAGYGWFLDPTPGDASEFDRGAAFGPAAGRADLLSVVTHELGHVLGFADQEGTEGVMAETLAVGVRQLPRAEAADPAGRQPGRGLGSEGIAYLLGGPSKAPAGEAEFAPAGPHDEPGRGTSPLSPAWPAPGLSAAKFTARAAAGKPATVAALDALFAEADFLGDAFKKVEDDRQELLC